MHFLTGGLESRAQREGWIGQWALWTIPNKNHKGHIHGDTNHQQTDGPPSAIHPVRPYRGHPDTTQAHSCPVRCVRCPMEAFLMVSPHSARLYAPPSPVFWFASFSLKRPNQASEAREMAKQNPGLAQDTQTHKMATSSRESNEHPISANAVRQTKSPIVASMTCPTQHLVVVVLLVLSWPSRLSCQTTNILPTFDHSPKRRLGESQRPRRVREGVAVPPCGIFLTYITYPDHRFCFPSLVGALR